MKRIAMVAACVALAGCMEPVPEGPAFEADGFPVAAPYAAAIRGNSVTLAFSGGRTSCIIDAPAGTGALADWETPVRGCRDVDYLRVSYRAPVDPRMGETLFAPMYTGELVVRELPPGAVSARVEVSGTAGTGWFEGRL
ncbi:MAG: hypothetical protein JJT81_08855 [Rubellimicrobium sp.]|nr:hypothetical protein [Rubellimicrobium sp.]